METVIKRIVAGWIDIFICNIPITLLMIYIMLSTNNLDIMYSMRMYFISISVLIFSYMIIGEMIGTTFGKSIFKLKTIAEGKYPFWKKMVRAFCKTISIYTWILLIPAIFMNNHCFYYDYILKTKVIGAI